MKEMDMRGLFIFQEIRYNKCNYKTKGGEMCGDLCQSGKYFF